MKKVKCLLLISGGLDSTLSAKILEMNGVKVQPICFESFFFGCNVAEKACKNLGMKLRRENISNIHLRMVKNPKHGHGSACNPCIDCHLMMLKEAKKIMKKEGYDFIATGEVLGQRPMSQNANALGIIEKETGLVNQIVRPLCLKLLAETEAEKKGLIARDGFYDISGKGRTRQIELAAELGVRDYPSPAGGCILTDANYGKLLFKLFEVKPKANGDDCLIMRQGRVFLEEDLIIVIARDKNESENIEKMKKKGDILLVPDNFSGPTLIMRPLKKVDKDEVIERGIELMLKYSKNTPEDFIVELK